MNMSFRKYVGFILILLISMSVIYTCSFLHPKITVKLANTIDKYCNEVPLSLRDSGQKLVNNLTEPGNTITITCKNDKINSIDKYSPKNNLFKKVRIYNSVNERDAILKAKLEYNKNYFRMPYEQIIYDKKDNSVAFWF